MLRSKNHLHDNYQDYQAFLANGGCIGLQHDPLLYGSYLLNPFLVKVELREMLVVRQGEVAVIKSYVGLPTEDTSGDEFKFGSIVKPGHQGIWSEPLRTGKYTLNPRIYEAEIVPTSILTLNWSHATSDAHSLDERLAPIDAKSQGGLHVQHRPPGADPRARHPGAEGHLHGRAPCRTWSTRCCSPRWATTSATSCRPSARPSSSRSATRSSTRPRRTSSQYLSRYEVETRGVYIQDVVFPADLVEVLTSREIAAQEKATFAQQQQAQEARVSLEQQRGVADMQGAAGPGQRVGRHREGQGRRPPAPGPRARPRSSPTTGNAEATRTQAIGEATASAEEALGLARAKGFDAQRQAIGSEQTALVAALREVGAGHVKIVPDIQVGGGGRRARRPRRHAHAQPGRDPQRQRPRGQRVRARPAGAGRR